LYLLTLFFFLPLVGPPPQPRQMHVIDDSEASETFAILNHNILCDRYATRSQYKYTPERALQWEYRRDLVFEEIKELNADVICLQECDQENFNEFFRGELAILGFKGIFFQKSRARTMIEREAKLVDGCAIFYRAAKFILLDKQLIAFANTAINRPDMKGEHDIFNRVMPRDNIAVVAFFENRMTGSRMIVTNAHLHWDVKEEDVKVVQTAILMDQIAEFADKWAEFPPCTDKTLSRANEPDLDIQADLEQTEPAPSQKYTSGSQIPLIVAGDFNSLKDSAVYELLAKGSLKKDIPEFSGRSYGKFTRDGIVNPFTLRNAYAGDPEDYIAITNYTPDFQGTIEYIFHSPSLRRRKVLGNVDFEYLQKVPGFPNYHFPSDHLALYAEFAVEPRKERTQVEANFGGNSNSNQERKK
jgi:CCR4-NOT transcription complex subunit 6